MERDADREQPATADRTGPPARVRLTGQALTRLIAHAPRLWPLLRRPMTRFFDRAAAHWDERIRPDSPEHLAALDAALERVDARPKRILDLGTGTGAAAFMLARRFPESEVVGVDISESMIRAAREKLAPELAGRVRFEVADAASLPLDDASFDLVAQVSVPVFFDEIARVLGRGGHALVVSSLGAATPCHTPERTLRRGFERRGLQTVATGSAGSGTFLVARRG